MAYNRIRFMPYGRKKAKSVEINVKDNENQSIDFFKVMKNKEKAGDFSPKKVSKILKDKHGFDFSEK